MLALDEQSPDIRRGVDSSYEERPRSRVRNRRQGAGDQGMMFGYASRDRELMPLPVTLAHRITERLASVRKTEVVDYLRPDGKAQVTVRYREDGGRLVPLGIERLLVSTQHHPDVHDEARIRDDIIEHVLRPVVQGPLCAHERFQDPSFVLVNPTGRFVTGGPMGDTGLTGRKIIVDTYGGSARHGGGAFSGKDPSKVDRSASYAMRWVAKNVVAADLADRAEVQVAYAIGVAHPVSVSVETFGTERVDRATIEQAVRDVFDLRPAAIIRELDLLRPVLPRDRGLRPLRPRAGRLHVGAHRPRRTPARGVRARGARAGPRLIARVQPLVTARSVDRTFDYGVPEGVELESGSRVLVPLGARQVDGVVVAVAEGDDDELKPIDEVIGRVPPALLDLAVWMADEYGSTLARALALVIPPRPPKRALKARDDFPDPDVAVVRRLTDAQRAAVAGCVEAAAAGEREVLLHGVTGSGKTEVYLAVIERALEQGRGAVVLVPEIALTPQTAGRFVARFGDTVAVLHSALTPARRGAEHARIAAGEARVVVGARSAVFAAMPDLGVIVIDEEHDGSYKHESDPRYDARRVAAKRARIEGAIAIYGSATPRPEAWQGIRRRLELPARIGGLLPRVEVVDLRRDGGYPFTRPLLDALAGLDDRGGRAILLQNRRGAAAALHCRTCARSWRCPRCDVSLVLHGRDLLVCHHCGLRERAPAACPACGSVDLARIGAGTERVELDLIERFPRLEVLRLDADVASRAGEPAATLDRFRAADRAVLVGTQIVAKGHDVPGVELAAVLDAETGLAMPDFRAEERTFALLTQLAGRPGRPGDERGRVIIQAWEPDGRPVALAARHAVGEFLDGELERRAELGYPPYRRLVRLLVTAPDTNVAQGVAEALEAAARPVLDGDALLGPAPIGRLRDRARSHLLVKTLDPRRAAVVFRGLLRDLAPDMRRADATAVVDVDPQTLG